MESAYIGTNKMIAGIVCGVLTFWLFAQAMVNIVPAVQSDIGISLGRLNTAISLTSLFSGMFIVAAGGLADKIGRKKITYIGFILSIIGSLMLVLAQGAGLLIIGRIIQGLSAACIMPATIALIKAYCKGPDRQRALSYWSIGSWGGSGICSLVGGAIATYIGWRWIYVLSILITILGMILLKDTPESKVQSKGPIQFDYTGLVIFVITMLPLNLFITRGLDWGWTSPLTLGCAVVAIVGFILFIKVESKKDVALIDFSLFRNKPYAGATYSNFLLNAVAGTLVVANIYVQVGRGFTAFQSGMLSIGYVIAVLTMIRVGEKMLQKAGAKLPMIWGAVITTVGIALMGLTFLPDTAYNVMVFIGFALFGLGLGIYATPSTDTSVANAPSDKIGEAAGVYKMASSLGSSFGVAISATVYGTINSFGSVESAATAGIIVNVIFGILAILSILLMVPKNAGKPSN
ncbi:MFS transporter [Paenibacillus marinisediminis]